MNAVVSNRKNLKPLRAIWTFKLDEKIDFKPGQFCNIKVGNVARPMSMSSLPGKDMEFYIKGNEDGAFVPVMDKLKVGDKVEIKGPYGSFYLRDSDSEIYFICAGSGISPVMSMVRAIKNRKATVLQGVSYEDELGYEDELRNANLTYIPTVSRPEENPNWTGETGRVVEHLDLLENKDAEVYICGPPPMVEEVISKLKKNGFKEESLFTERYY